MQGDGTYDPAFQAGNNTLSPNITGAGNAFKTNVHRQKTRKWVEAKVANYDGDDWGDEEDDEDEDIAPPPMPSNIMPTLPRLHQHQQKYQQQLQQQEQQQRQDECEQTMGQSESDKRQDTSSPPLPSVTVIPSLYTTAAPDPSSASAPAPVSAQPPIPTSRTTNVLSLPVRTGTPETSNRSVSSPLLSQEVLSHSPSHQLQGISSLPSTWDSPLTGTRSVSSSLFDSATHQSAEPLRTGTPLSTTMTASESTIPASSTLPITFYPVRTTSTPIGSSLAQSSASIPAGGNRKDKRIQILDDTTEKDSRRTSTSPQLPDVARMSMFAVDFESSFAKGLEEAPPMPSLPPLSVMKKENSVSELNTPFKDKMDTTIVSSATATLPALSISRQTKPALPPLTTSPTLAPASLVPPHDQSTTDSPNESSASIHTASPVKESDRLREEIMQSLGPSNRNLNPDDHVKPSRQSTRESNYLPSLYDDYWASNGDVHEDKAQENLSGLGLDAQTSTIAPLSSSKPRTDDEIEPAHEDKISVERESGHTENQHKDEHSDQEIAPISESSGPKRFSWEAVLDSPTNTVGGLPTGPLSSTASSSGTASALQPSMVIHSSSPSGDQSPVKSPMSTETPPPKTQAIRSMLDVGESSSSSPPKSHSVAAELSSDEVVQSSGASTNLPEVATVDAVPESSHETSVPDVSSAVPRSISPPAASSNLMTPPSQITGTFDSRPTTAAAALRSPPSRVIEPIDLREMTQSSSLSTERLKDMIEAREYYRVCDTGLTTWLSSMVAEYPEYRLESRVFSKSIAPALLAAQVVTAPPLSTGLGPRLSSTSTVPSPYQPAFFDSGSTAPSPNPVTPSFPASGSTGGFKSSPGSSSSGLASAFHIPTTTSDLKQSGVKGKDFLLAAGKAGKGLLSKGKHKLRGEKEPDSLEFNSTLVPDPRLTRVTAATAATNAQISPEPTGLSRLKGPFHSVGVRNPPFWAIVTDETLDEASNLHPSGVVTGTPELLLEPCGSGGRGRGCGRSTSEAELNILGYRPHTSQDITRSAEKGPVVNTNDGTARASRANVDVSGSAIAIAHVHSTERITIALEIAPVSHQSGDIATTSQTTSSNPSDITITPSSSPSTTSHPSLPHHFSSLRPPRSTSIVPHVPLVMSRNQSHALSNRPSPSTSPFLGHTRPEGWIEVSSQVDLPDVRHGVRNDSPAVSPISVNERNLDFTATPIVIAPSSDPTSASTTPTTSRTEKTSLAEYPASSQSLILDSTTTISETITYIQLDHDPDLRQDNPEDHDLNNKDDRLSTSSPIPDYDVSSVDCETRATCITQQTYILPTALAKNEIEQEENQEKHVDQHQDMGSHQVGGNKGKAASTTTPTSYEETSMNRSWDEHASSNQAFANVNISRESSFRKQCQSLSMTIASPGSDRPRDRRPSAHISIRTDLASPTAFNGPLPLSSAGSSEALVFQSGSLMPSALMNNPAVPVSPRVQEFLRQAGEGWQAQESQLAEPLAQSRNRSLSPARLMPDDVTSFEKEIGEHVYRPPTSSSSSSSSGMSDMELYQKAEEAGVETSPAAAEPDQDDAPTSMPAVIDPPPPQPQLPVQPPVPEPSDQRRLPRMASVPLEAYRTSLIISSTTTHSSNQPQERLARSSILPGLGINLPRRDSQHEAFSDEPRQVKRQSSFFGLRHSSSGPLVSPSSSQQNFGISSRASMLATTNTQRPLSVNSRYGYSMSGLRSATSPLGIDVMNSDSIPSPANKHRFSGLVNLFRRSVTDSRQKTETRGGTLRKASMSLADLPIPSFTRNSSHIISRPMSQGPPPTAPWEIEERGRRTSFLSRFGSRPSSHSRPSSRTRDSQIYAGSTPNRSRHNSPYRPVYGERPTSEAQNSQSSLSFLGRVPGASRSQTTLPTSPGFPPQTIPRPGTTEWDSAFRHSAHSLVSATSPRSSLGARSSQVLGQDFISGHARTPSNVSERFVMTDVHRLSDGSSHITPGYTGPGIPSPFSEPPSMPISGPNNGFPMPQFAFPNQTGFQLPGFPPGHQLPSSHTHALPPESQNVTLATWLSNNRQTPFAHPVKSSDAPPPPPPSGHSGRGIFSGFKRKSKNHTPDLAPAAPTASKSKFKAFSLTSRHRHSQVPQNYPHHPVPPVGQNLNQTHPHPQPSLVHYNAMSISNNYEHGNSQFYTDAGNHPRQYVPYTRPIRDGPEHYPEFNHVPVASGYTTMHSGQLMTASSPGLSTRSIQQSETPSPHLHYGNSPFPSPNPGLTNQASIPTSILRSYNSTGTPAIPGSDFRHYNHHIQSHQLRPYYMDRPGVELINQSSSPLSGAPLADQIDTYKSRSSEEQPKMSATSYPGQEWVPDFNGEDSE